jgi:hypothetical protein
LIELTASNQPTNTKAPRKRMRKKATKTVAASLLFTVLHGCFVKYLPNPECQISFAYFSFSLMISQALSGLYLEKL